MDVSSVLAARTISFRQLDNGTHALELRLEMVAGQDVDLCSRRMAGNAWCAAIGTTLDGARTAVCWFACIDGRGDSVKIKSHSLKIK